MVTKNFDCVKLAKHRAHAHGCTHIFEVVSIRKSGKSGSVNLMLGMKPPSSLNLSALSSSALWAAWMQKVRGGSRTRPEEVASELHYVMTRNLRAGILLC